MILYADKTSSDNKDDGSFDEALDDIVSVP